MASGAADKVPVPAPEPTEPVVIICEAGGSALLCGGIFAVASWLGNADVRTDAITVIAGATTIGMLPALPGAEVASAADRSS